MNESINFTQIILQTINELFNNLFSSIDNSLYGILDSITFINTDIIHNNLFINILGNNSSEGILLICNSLVIGFIIYFSINYLLSHLIYSQSETPKQFIFRAIIFIAIMNSSLWICEEIILINSLVTDSISSIGNTLFNSEVTFSKFINNLNGNIYLNSNEFNILSFDGLIKSFSTFGLLNLIFTYSLRYILIQILVLISPFAFISLLNQKSSFFFRVWLKSFISLLIVQVFISLVLLLSYTIDINSNSLISKILYTGVIYALLKANSYVKELFGGLSLDINSNMLFKSL